MSSPNTGTISGGERIKVIQGPEIVWATRAQFQALLNTTALTPPRILLPAAPINGREEIIASQSRQEVQLGLAAITTYLNGTAPPDPIDAASHMGSISGTELVEAEQDGITVQLTLAQLQQFVTGGAPPVDNGLAPTMTSATSASFAENVQPRYLVTFSKETLRDFLFGPNAGYWEVEGNLPYATSFYVRWAGGGLANYEDPLGNTVDGETRLNSYALIIRPTDRYARTGIDYTLTISITDVNEQPTGITFTPLTNQARSTRVYSNTVTVGLPAGVTATIPAITGLVAGDGMQKNGAGGFGPGPFSLVNTDTLQAAVTTSAAYSTLASVSGVAGEPPAAFSFNASTLADPSAVPAFSVLNVGQGPTDIGYSQNIWTHTGLGVGTAKSSRYLLIFTEYAAGGPTSFTVNGTTYAEASVRLADITNSGTGQRLMAHAIAIPTGTTIDFSMDASGQVFGYQIATIQDVNVGAVTVGSLVTGYQDPHQLAVTVPSPGFSLAVLFLNAVTGAATSAVSGTTIERTASQVSGPNIVAYVCSRTTTGNIGINKGDADHTGLALTFGV